MNELENEVHVDVDTEVCVGSGTCAMIDPEHFRLVDGKAQVVAERVPATEDLVDAVADCPVQALSVKP